MRQNRSTGAAVLPIASRKMILLVCIAVASILALIDSTTSFFDPARQQLNTLLTPFFEVAKIPRLGDDFLDKTLKSNQELFEDIAYLETQLLAKSLELKKMSQILSQNQDLQSLFEVTTALEQESKVAQVLVFRITPIHHKLVINKGRESNIVPGSFVFDAKGIIGQVHLVGRKQSWVTLLTDPRHGVPAKTSKGVVGVVQGTGELERLRLEYVPETSDINVGDVVTTTGLGGRFQPNFDLGVVTKIIRQEQQLFASIDLRPAVNFTDLGFVLVLPPATERLEAQETFE